ncbi:unnamed protein product [Camellia sinensis]
MYRDRGGGGGGSWKSEIVGEPLDRKRMNDALDKQLQKSSPLTSRGLNSNNNSKDKERVSLPSTCTSAKNKCSDAEESETDSEESDVSGSDGDDTSWISWFCNLRGNEFFCEVDDEYIQDDFNLCGLSSLVPYYDYALDLILDVESSHGDSFTEEQNELVESAAEMLYGLIHVRYILTSKGMATMLDKYKNFDFGRCPRVYCCGQPCLPVGQSDIPRSSTYQVFDEYLCPTWIHHHLRSVRTSCIMDFLHFAKILMELVLEPHFLTCFLLHTGISNHKRQHRVMFQEYLASRSTTHDARRLEIPADGDPNFVPLAVLTLFLSIYQGF